ncbi:MAG: PepSY domain-containing protein [Actinobacteria bacterium]|nr:PepSY domain-containing protein [Actinomycetota bacterium]
MSLLVDLHNLVGTLAAVSVIIVSITGILLNHIDLLGLAGPPAAPAGQGDELLPIEEIVERARLQLRGEGEPPDLGRAVWDLNEGAVAVRFDTRPPTQVTVDAASGEALGTVRRHDLDVSQAHSGELLGPVWVVLSDFAGVALIIVLFAGVWIWLRRVRARGRLVGARPGSGWLRANWWFHLVGGLLAVVFLLVLSITGILLNHKRDLGLMADPPNLPDHRDETTYVPLGVVELVDAAIDARGGGFGLDDVQTLDYRPSGYAKVRFSDADHEVIVDGADGTPIEESRRWDVWVEDLHSGLLFGTRGSLLSDFGAVMAILLTVNGTYLWLVPAWRARNRSARA